MCLQWYVACVSFHAWTLDYYDCIAAVTLNPDLLARVIPQDQSFDDDDYTGERLYFIATTSFLYTLFVIYWQACSTFDFGSMATGMMLLLMINYHFIRTNSFTALMRKILMRCGLPYLKKLTQSKCKRNWETRFIVLSLLFQSVWLVRSYGSRPYNRCSYWYDSRCWRSVRTISTWRRRRETTQF